ncbi:MAG: TonB-dependent receptor plug domain-containing protein [Bdellovibrionia bacterium]
MEKIVIEDQKSVSELRSAQDFYQSKNIITKSQTNQQLESFSESLAQTRGVQVQASCAFCGSKRLTLNGLKAEHTAILVDNLPLYSSVSSFYAVDAIPNILIEDTLVFRGAGSTLLSGETIGGALNIKTKEPFRNYNQINIAIGDSGERKLQILSERRLRENHAVMIAGEISDWGAVDKDNNKVTEAPFRETKNVSWRSAHDISKGVSLTSRLSYNELNVFGGSPHKIYKDGIEPSPEPDDFINGDVRNRFIGDSQRITDNIFYQRLDFALQGKWDQTENQQWNFSLGGAKQSQEALYNHGFDYDSVDEIQVLQIENTTSINDRLNVQSGVVSKHQDYQSESQELYQVMNLRSDSFTLANSGLWSEATWAAADPLLFNLGLRGDQYVVEWRDLGQKLHKQALSWHFSGRYQHSPEWTSKVGVGRAHRVPLTMFESQHGLNEHGFEVAIEQLEQATTLQYSALYQTEWDYFEWNVLSTNLKHMAYAQEQSLSTDPLLYTNSQEDYEIGMSDVAYGRQLSEKTRGEIIFERYFYPHDYKEKLPVAAIEEKLQLKFEYNQEVHFVSATATRIGSRHLRDYGYDKNYNRVEGTFPDPEEGKDLKKQISPEFWTLDLGYENKKYRNVSIRFDCLNCLDETQTKRGDSPLTWAEHKGHFHIDNLHLWGPLRGRQLFASVTWIL